MKKQLLNGLTTLILPFTTYAATGTLSNSYQRADNRAKSSASLVLPLHSALKVESGLPALNTEAVDLVITKGRPVNELVIIDAAVPDKQTLYRGLNPGVEAVEIASDADGLAQLIRVLENYRDISSVHFITHATDGKMLLGNSWITADSIKDRTDVFDSLKQSVKPGGDLLFYGCEFAAGEAGEAFLDIVSGNTELDTAASSDITGDALQAGDWELEIAQGDIEGAAPFSEKALKDYTGVLAPATYTGLQLYNDNTPSSYYYQSSITTGDSKFVLTGVTGNRISALNGGVGIGYVYASSGSGLYGKSLQVAADGTNVGTFELNTVQLSVGALGCSASDIYANVTIEGYYAGGGSAGSQNANLGTATTFCGYGDVDTIDVSSTFGPGKALAKFVIKYNGTAPSNRYYLMSSFTVDNLQTPDSTPPTISSVSIPNTAMKVGDTVTATITVTSDTDDYTTGSGGISGTIGGFSLGSLSKTNSTTYTATFTVTNGGTDVAAGSNVPVNFTLTDSAGNTSSAYTTAISQASDSIDANVPTITSVTIPNAAAKVGDAITVSITAGEAGLSLNSGTVNGVALTGFTDLTGGNYSATYTVTEGNTDRAAGDSIPVSLILDDSGGNSSATYTTSITQNADAIDANSPTIASVSIPNSPMKVGDAVTVTITAGETGLSLNSGTVNGVSVTGFTDNADNSYSATYTVVEGNTDRAAGADIPVSFVLTDSGGNSSNTYTTAISQNADTIDANSPTISSVTIPNSSAKVGDAITVTITAGETGLSLNSGSVNGVAVTGFTDNSDNTYSATYTVAEGNTDRAAGDSIPVSFVLNDSIGNNSSTYSTAISQGSDAIDANTPSVAEITAVTTPGNDSTPSVTFSTNETGTLSVGGSCGTSSSTTISSTGNTTITLTQTDDSTPLADGTYSDCTVTITDAGGNVSSAVTLTSFTIDATAPTLAEVTAVTTPGSDSTPSVTFSTNETGTLSMGGSCGTSSSTTISATGNQMITLTQPDNTTPLAEGSYSDCTVTVTDAAGNASSALTLSSFTVDVSAPTLSEITAVANPGNDSTPSVTFSTTEIGTLSIGGSCGTSSSTTISATGNQTITLTQTDNSTPLAEGSYSDCTVTVTDAAGNASSALALSSFTVDVTAPTLSEVTAVTTPGNDTTPDVTFSTNETGTLSIGGSCGTSSSTTIGSTGNQTITLTQADNSTPLAEASYTDCTVTVTDAAGNASTALSLTSFAVDATAPTVAEVTAVVTPGNDNTPGVTISSNENGTLTIGGSCGSASEGAVSAGNITLSLTQTDNSSALADGTYSDCTATVTDAAGNASSAVALSSFVVDTAAPTLAEVSAVSSPTSDSTPDVTFSTTEDGTLSLGGSCGTSSSTSVTSGNVTLTLTGTDNTSPLSDNTYSDCTVTVTDASGNASSALALTSFIVDVAAPTVAEVTAVATPGNDTTPSVTISSSEAGTLAVSGSCGSSDEGAITAGNTTITLTDTDNTSALADGTYSDCTVTVTDAGSNASNVVTLTSFTVDATAPTVGTNAGLSIDEGDTASIIGATQLAANDNLSSAVNITYTLVADVSNGTLRNNGSALAGGGSFTQADVAADLITYDHDGGETTSDSFTFNVSDGLGNVNNNGGGNFTFSMAIAAVNDPPSTTDDSSSTNEDNAVMVDVLANDADSDDAINAASVNVASAPANGSTSVNTGTGVITYTPDADFNGSDSFTYTVQDATGDTSAAATVTITVNAVNDAPVAVADTVNTDVDTPVTIDVAANDSDVDTGDAVDTATLVIVTSPTNGSAVVNAGQIDYTPGAGYLGSDSLTYTIDDGNGATSNVATVTISVNDPNTAPTAANDSATTDEDTAVVVNVLTNDSDPDGSLVASTVTVVSNATNGITMVNTTTGEITYTPSADFNGSDSFTYTVEDDSGAPSSAATVTVTVNSVNDAPVANSDMVTLLEDASLSINVLGNDTDVDGTLNAASLTVVTNAASGVAVLDGNNILYTPLDDFVGNDSFTYTVEDNEGLVSNTATVTLTIDPVNDAPLANNDSFTIVANAASVLTLTDNDSDIDGTLDNTSIAVVSAPGQGTLMNNNDGTLTYTPNAGVDPLAGDSFTYTVDDDSGATSAAATVTISFMPSMAPMIAGTPGTEAREAEAYSFTPDTTVGDSLFPLTYSIVNGPGWASFNTQTGQLSGTPLLADVGTTTGIVISVSDGVNSASLSAFDLEVLAGVDTDGDTITDHQEGLDGTDPNDPLDYLDLTPPELTAPEDIIVDAVGLFTPVPITKVLGLSADADQTEVDAALATLAFDNVDGAGCCSPELMNEMEGQLLLRPGDNRVTWQAEDRMGNTASVTQHVYVRPLVSFGRSSRIAEGSDFQMRILLNGDAPFYPFEVPYVIGNASTVSADDHSLENGSVIFNEGETEASVTISTVADNLSEGAEVLFVLLDDHTTNDEDLADGFDADIYDINAGAPSLFRLTIIEQNVPPVVHLTIRQNGVNTIQVTPGGGDVEIVADVSDSNINDSYMLDWSGTDIELGGGATVMTNSLVLDPTGLSAGRYKVKVKATDSGNAFSTDVVHFLVVASLPVLSASDDTDGDGSDDLSEGTADTDSDGIPEYLDNITVPNVLPEQAGVTDAFLLECDPGVRCRLSEFSVASNGGGARLQMSELDSMSGLKPDNNFTLTSVFDFEMTDLEEQGQTTNVVIPQTVVIPANAHYRKFQNGQWQTFVEDANNRLASAPGSEGYCPPPGDSSWQAGLTEGHWCVQLTIEDGGPNDSDGEVNGSVADPGGVGTQKTLALKTGGGSTGLLMLLALGGLAAARRWRQLAGPLALVALVGLMPVSSRADNRGSFFVEFTGTKAESSQSLKGFIEQMQVNAVNPTVLDYDNVSGGFQLKLGHQYNEHLAAMVGYVDLGEGEVNLRMPSENDEIVESALGHAYPHLGAGLILNARVKQDLGQYFSVYTDLGVNFWRSEVKASGTDIETSLNGMDPWGALGGQLNLDRMYLGLSYQYFKLESRSASAVGVNLGLRF